MDADEPPSPEHTPDHTTTPSFSGVDANSSFRSNRRSRASRTSERESLEEEIRRTVKGLRAQADAERRRADAAERKVREVTAHLQAVNDARLEALRDAGRAKEELRLYKIQLDTAQKEIYRAQEVIGTVDRQRHDAEKDAARSRTRARQLHEAILVQTAREEAYRLGMQEGLDRGRAIGHVEPPMSAGEEDEEYTDDGLSEGGSYRDPPRRQRSIMAPSGHSRADSRSQAAPTALPVPPPADVLPVNPPSNYAPSVRAPSVRPESMRGRSPNTSHAPQSNYATSARGPSPNPSMTRPPSNYGPSIRGPSPNPSNARPPSNYAPSMRTASPNPSMIRPSSTYAPSMRGPSPNPSNARPPSTYAPSMRAASPNPSNARPSSNYAPSMRAASPGPSYSRAPSTHAPSIRAPSVSEGTGMRRPSSVLSFAPTPHHPTVAVPPDNLIPTLDTDLRIRLPPPHEFMARTPERAPSPALPAGAASESSVTSQEPLPVPLRTAAPGRAGRHRRGSSAGSGSSTLSTLELFSNPYAAGMRTPMSAIEEVSSQASPAHYEGHHGRSFSENSAGRHATPSVRGEDRPPSRSSYAGSWMHPAAPAVAPADDRRSQRSYNSDAPHIDIQPPSLSESQRGASPAPSSQRGMPGYYQQSPVGGPPVVPVEPLRYDREPRHPALQGQARRAAYDDDAVSSALTADTLTTPPHMNRPIMEGGRGW